MAYESKEDGESEFEEARKRDAEALARLIYDIWKRKQQAALLTEEETS
jgi:hypothetical protein